MANLLDSICENVRLDLSMSRICNQNNQKDILVSSLGKGTHRR